MKYLLILTLFISGCHSQGLEDNQLLKDEIDKQVFSECNMILELDSEERIIDTVTIWKKKFDQRGNLTFKTRMFAIGNENYISNTYFWEDGTDFLSTTESDSKHHTSYSEVFRTRSKEQIKLISYSDLEGRLDTVIVNYHYDYFVLGGKKRLTATLDSKDIDLVQIFEYNNGGKIKTDINLMGIDTLDKTEYFYLKQNISKTKKIQYSMDTLLTVMSFNEFEKTDSIMYYSIHKNINIIDSLISYNYDEQANYLGYDVVDYRNNKIRNFVSREISCDQW